MPSPSDAAARQHRGRGARNRDAGAVPGSSAMRDRRSQLTIAAVAALLGLLVVVQLRTQTGGSALQNKSAQDLTTLVGNLNTRNDQLRREVGQPRGPARPAHGGQGEGATSVDQIQAELGRIRAWSGLDPVAGRGVTIVVNGAIDGTPSTRSERAPERGRRGDRRG